MSRSVEELLEALNEAHRLREVAEQKNTENELLLSGLRSLLEARTPKETYENLFKFFGRIIPYQIAFVLEKDDADAMHCTLSTHNEFLRQTWQMDAVLERTLSGQPCAVYDVVRQPTWSFDKRYAAMDVASALYCPFNGPGMNAVLVFCHAEKGFYMQKHVQMAEKYRHFTEQTLLSMNAKLQALDSERLRQEKERAENTLIQSEKMASLGLLAAGVAHEINNPIAYVSSNISYLMGTAADIKLLKEKISGLLETGVSSDDEKLRAECSVLDDWISKKKIDYSVDDLADLVQDCQEGIGRVRDIVSSLGSFARSHEACATTVDINDCINSTLKLVSNELKYHCDLQVSLEATHPVFGNQGKINQVITNLLVNAGQAIEDKGWIQVTTGTDTHGALGLCTWFKVEDNGVGIAPENLKRVFEPFYSSKDVSQGTGLGLSISYSIIEKMNGTLEVYSQLGKGTSFVAYIPVFES